jgi:hypothetical protein
MRCKLFFCYISIGYRVCGRQPAETTLLCAIYMPSALNRRGLSIVLPSDLYRDECEWLFSVDYQRVFTPLPLIIDRGCRAAPSTGNDDAPEARFVKIAGFSSSL